MPIVCLDFRSAKEKSCFSHVGIMIHMENYLLQWGFLNYYFSLSLGLLLIHSIC